MAGGIGYDSAPGRAICGAISAIMTGVSYATSAEMARELGPFPGYHANAADMLRVIRNHRRAAYGQKDGYEKLATAAGAARPRGLPGRGTDRSRQARLGPRHRARPEPRLPQRAGDRRRADRHHRPRHGLRHDRHRARLRAREVQEARRRRLLQDHQPRRAGGAAHARLPRERDRRDRGLRRRPRLAGAGARDQSRDPEGQGLRRRSAGQDPCGPGKRLRHQVRLQQVGAGRELHRRQAQGPGRQAQGPGVRPADGARLHQEGHRSRQRARLRSDDAGRRAAPQGGAPVRSSIAPTRAAARASAISRSTATST